MLATLKRRTESDFYLDMKKGLKERHVPEAVIDSIIRDAIHDARVLFRGCCPQCGAPSARYVDFRRQQGSSELRGTGVWVQYRCSTAPPPGTVRPPEACDFMADHLEPIAANE